MNPAPANAPAPSRTCRVCAQVLPDTSPDTVCAGCVLVRVASTVAAGAGAPLEEPDFLPECRDFGDYELIEEIARGGQGVVYKARQKSLGRWVAIKMLLLGPLANSDYVERFRYEAIAAGGLHHPNIVQIHEVGLHDGQPFIVMEYIEGQDLARHLSAGPLPGRRAATYLSAVADAVHCAHEAGILHRDLKPSNILVDFVDQPQVTDFGLARRLDEAEGVTLTGQMLGSPNYIPPEQAVARRGTVGRPSDVYGLGAVLYHLLTGRPPFAGESIADTLDQTLNSQLVRPRWLNPGISADLETICLKCLEKEPEKRYPTAAALRDDLQRFLRDEPIRARPIGRVERGWRWCRRKPALAAALGAAALLLLVVLIGSPLAIFRISRARANEAQQRQRAEAAAKSAVEKQLEARRSEYAADMLLAQKFMVDNQRGRALELIEKYQPGHGVPALAGGGPDGNAGSEFEVTPNRLKPGLRTETDLRGWEWHYLSTQTRGQELAVLRGHRTQVNDLACSPDGHWLASGGLDGSVKVWDVSTRRLAKELELRGGSDLHEVYAVIFSPDGKQLISCSDMDNRIFFWNVNTWTRNLVLTNQYRVNVLGISPDGHFLAAGGAYGLGGVVVWNLAERRPITSWPMGDAFDPPFALAFSSDSKLLFHDLGFGRLGRCNLESREQLPPIKLPERQYSLRRVLFAENGTLAATGGVDGTLRVWSLPAWKQIYQLTNEYLLSISLSENLLVTAHDQEMRRWRLLTGEPLGGMFGHLEGLSAGTISPKAKLIATAGCDKTVRLWPLIPPEPRRLTIKLLTNDRPVFLAQMPKFSPDGLWAVTAQTNHTLTVWDATRLELVVSRAWPIPELETMNIASGGKSVVVGGRGGKLLLIDAASGETLVQTRLGSNTVYFVRFSPDGSRLVVHHQEANGLASGYHLEILDARTLKPVRELGASGGTVHDAVFTPDNHYLAVAYYNAAKTEVVDLETGQIVARHPDHTGRVISIAITPDARLVASCAGDGPVHVWDGRTGQSIAKPFRGSWETYQAVALSPDGSRLAASGNGIDLWDLVSHRQVQTLLTTNEWIYALAWTPDAKRLTTASFESLRLWPADSYGAPPGPTNVLARELDVLEARSASDLAGVFSIDERTRLPFLDEQIARGDPDGFWRKARGLARLWKLDLAGAAEDDPAYAIPARDAGCTSGQVDLTKFYNCLLVPDGFRSLGCDLAEVPVGLHTLDGVPFDLRGVVQVAGAGKADANYPREVKGIPVERTCQRLHFLHSSQLTASQGNTLIGRYVLHYDDGETRELPIVDGSDLREVWAHLDQPPETAAHAQIAWQGNCPLAASRGRSLRLWKRTYENPRPGVKIVQLDFVSAMNNPAPFLVALTVE